MSSILRSDGQECVRPPQRASRRGVSRTAPGGDRWHRWALRLVGLAVVLPVTLAAQTPRPFDFRGHRMGDTAWTVTGDCLQLAPAVRGCQAWTTIGDTRVKVTYGFRAGRFTSLSYTFEVAHFPAIVAALTEKFGPPDTTWTEAVQNALGAQYVNEIVAWRTDGGILEARKYGTRLDVSRVGIESPAGAAAEKAAADSLAQRAKQDL